MKAEAYPLWPDVPADLDLLGFGDIAASVIDVLRRERLDPITVGLFGNWGSGKSTILDLVGGMLEANDIAVRVRPWEYERHDDVKALLIGEVLAAIRKKEAKALSASQKLKTQFDELAQRIKWSKALSLVVKGALLQVPSVDEVIGVFGSKQDETGANLAMFREEFAEALKELKEVRRVVVLVDDLDRCLPPAVVATLEAIKLFLSVPKMAFVIAADQRSVTLAIATNYQGSDAEVLADQYLEKIVQIPIRIPRLGVADTESYLALMLVRDRTTADEYAELVKHSAGQRASGAADLLAGMRSALATKLADDIRLARVLAPVLYKQLDGNPRRLKRFLNAYWIRSEIARRRSVSLEPAVLAKLMVLEEAFPKEFPTILGWLANGELAAKLAALESVKDTSEKGAHPQLAEWAALPPPLAGRKDLEPYLRLAASFRTVAPGAHRLRQELQLIADALANPIASARKAAQKEVAKLSSDDQNVLVGHLAEMAWQDPSHHQTVAESLVAIVGTDDGRAKLVVADLSRLPGRDVSMPLVVQLLSGRPIPPSFRRLLETWNDDPEVPDLVRAAVGEGLERK